MSKKHNDIFGNRLKEIPEDDLLSHVRGELHGEELHDLQAQSVDDPFLEDAMEGLEKVDKKDDIKSTVTSLNQQLRKQVKSAKKKRKGKLTTNESWLYYNILIILLLCIIGYIVVKRFLN